MSEKPIIDAKQIPSLLQQVRDTIDIKAVYNHVLLRLDVDSMKQANAESPIRKEEMYANFAYAGFLEGVEFAMRNLTTEGSEETT